MVPKEEFGNRPAETFVPREAEKDPDDEELLEGTSHPHTNASSSATSLSSSVDNVETFNTVLTSSYEKRFSRSSSNIIGEGDTGHGSHRNRTSAIEGPPCTQNFEAARASATSIALHARPVSFLNDSSSSEASSTSHTHDSHADGNGNIDAKGWHRFDEDTSNTESSAIENFLDAQAPFPTSEAEELEELLCSPFVQEKAARLLGFGLDGYALILCVCDRY